MKYCKNCGKELNDDAVVCINCGCSVDNANANQPAKTNVLSIIGFIFSFLFPIVGLVCSIVGLNQIGKAVPKQSGKGLAIAGIIISVINWIAGMILLSMFQ